MTSVDRPLAGEPVLSDAARIRSPRYDIRHVVFLGAGTMGARIAAHVANAGIRVLLLDFTCWSGLNRNMVAEQALESLKKAKPAALADGSVAARIRTGNFDDDLGKLNDCDWIIEAVAENLEIKRKLLALVAPHLKREAYLYDEYERAAGDCDWRAALMTCVSIGLGHIFSIRRVTCVCWR